MVRCLKVLRRRIHIVADIWGYHSLQTMNFGDPRPVLLVRAQIKACEVKENLTYIFITPSEYLWKSKTFH